MLALFKIPAHLGYWAVGSLIGIESMGVPVPGETALIAAGIAAKSGQLQIEWVIVVAAAGAIVGDNIGYLIGRKGGRKLLERPGPFYQRRLVLLAHGDRFFAAHGAKAVFLGRWFALLRITAAWMAGANKMSAPTFFFYNALGGITWATACGLAGYFLGQAGERLLKTVGVGGAIAVGVLLVAGLVWFKLRERRTLRRERAALAAEGE